MKALVTGANGFLGSALVRRLLEHGQEHSEGRGEPGVRCLVRPGSDWSRLDALVERFPGGFEVVEGTLDRAEDCARTLEGVDCVFHLAAAKGGAPADMFRGSVVGTRNLLEALASRQPGARLVHCSSFGVYGVAGLPRGAVVDEETPLEPRPERRDLYSHTKHRQEELVRTYHRERGIPTVILRPGVIYGPGGGALSSRIGLELFGLFLHLGRKNLLPLTYVDNCAEALVCAARNGRFEGEAYNVVDDDPVDARTFLRRYRREVRRLRVVPMPRPAPRLLSAAVERYHAYSRGQLPAVLTRYKHDNLWKPQRFDNRKLRALGWTPVVNTSEGLDRHFAHLRQGSSEGSSAV